MYIMHIFKGTGENLSGEFQAKSPFIEAVHSQEMEIQWIVRYWGKLNT